MTARRPLRARVTAVARHDWEGAWLEPPLYAPSCHDVLARRMKRKAALTTRHPDPLHYVARSELVALPEDVGGYGVETDGALIRFSWVGSPRSCGLRIYYGLARCLLLRQFGEAFTEADAWLLALEAGIPRARLAEVGPVPFAREQLHMPLWAIEAVHLDALRGGGEPGPPLSPARLAARYYKKYRQPLTKVLSIAIVVPVPAEQRGQETPDAHPPLCAPCL